MMIVLNINAQENEKDSIFGIIGIENRVLIHTDEKIKMYIYPETIEVDDERYIQLWGEVVVQNSQKKEYYPMAFMEQLILVDCNTRKFNVLIANEYNKDKILIDSGHQDEDYAKRNLFSATRGHAADKIIEYVCKKLAQR